ncbi:MAG TPA: FkbM family methyltransferase, partial [Gemmatimonadales bacterium]|nr:FkbM family methyltransferase [Gemmatimonadales bacterium]
MLVDIGCSGGINPLWRSFGSRLRALGIDPSLAEVERLTSAETHPGVRYLAALAGLPPDHAFVRQKQGRGPFSRIPWNRLSTARSLEIMKSARELSSSEKAAANLWDPTKQSNDVVVVPDYLRENGMSSVDFVKIDVDGADFDILNSFDSALDELGILGLGIEVNYFGSDLDTDHTFHNVDRFMKARGFELFGLTVRRYSVAALPARYVWHLPSATEFGRPLQGDAFYARDLASGDYDAFAARLSAEKLLNLVCLFAAANLPDCAAEVALRFRSRLDAYDVDRILDALAAQAQRRSGQPLSYREYLDRFEAHDDMFFAPEPGSPPPIPNATVVPLPNLFDIRSRDTTGESTVVAEDPFELITPARQWSYAVSMVTRQDVSAADRSACVVISASVLVRSGCLGVGWLFHDRDEFLFERYLDEGTNRTIVLRVPVTAVPGRLMFRNAGATGPSRFVLRDVHARLETAPLYGVSVEPRVGESDTGTAGATSGAFDDGEAITINAARLGFLSRLGIPLTRKRVLDAGCGVGHHTPFY